MNDSKALKGRNQKNMKNETLISIFIIFIIFVSCQKQEKQTVNFELKKELSEIHYRDQVLRNITDQTPQDSLFAIAKRININPEYFKNNYKSISVKLDGENIKKIEEIISKYGYPGKSLVGEPENKTAWLVIQHSSKIDKYLSLIEKEANKKEIPFTLYAMMLDRSLMYQKKNQIFGTQGSSFLISKNGKEEKIDIIWPINNEDINMIRMKAGFKETIEEYGKSLFGKDFIYRKYTLSEALQLQNQQLEHDQ